MTEPVELPLPPEPPAPTTPPFAPAPRALSATSRRALIVLAALGALLALGPPFLGHALLRKLQDEAARRDAWRYGTSTLGIVERGSATFSRAVVRYAVDGHEHRVQRGKPNSNKYVAGDTLEVRYLAHAPGVGAVEQDAEEPSPIEDTIAFALLLPVIVCGVWLAGLALRRRRALVHGVPVLAEPLVPARIHLVVMRRVRYTAPNGDVVENRILAGAEHLRSAPLWVLVDPADQRSCVAPGPGELASQRSLGELGAHLALLLEPWLPSSLQPLLADLPNEAQFARTVAQLDDAFFADDHLMSLLDGALLPFTLTPLDDRAALQALRAARHIYLHRRLREAAVYGGGGGIVLTLLLALALDLQLDFAGAALAPLTLAFALLAIDWLVNPREPLPSPRPPATTTAPPTTTPTTPA